MRESPYPVSKEWALVKSRRWLSYEENTGLMLPDNLVLQGKPEIQISVLNLLITSTLVTHLKLQRTVGATPDTNTWVGYNLIHWVITYMEFSFSVNLRNSTKIYLGKTLSFSILLSAERNHLITKFSSTLGICLNCCFCMTLSSFFFFQLLFLSFLF